MAACHTGVINLDSQTLWHSVSVSGIVIDDHGRALLIRRRDNQRWEPPGGILELAESIHDGLLSWITGRDEQMLRVRHRASRLRG